MLRLRRLVLVFAVVSAVVLLASSAYAEHKGGEVESQVMRSFMIR